MASCFLAHGLSFSLPRIGDGATASLGPAPFVEEILKYQNQDGGRGSRFQDMKDQEGWTPLHCGVDRGLHANVKVLLDYGSDPSRRMPDGSTTLQNAVRGHDARVVELLLRCQRRNGKSGSRLQDVKNDAGGTPLHEAAWLGCDDVVKILLDYGSDPFRQTTDGFTALHSAVVGGNPPAVEFILEHESLTGLRERLQEKRDASGWTPLHRAVWQDTLNSVKILLNNGSDPLKSATDGSTALHLAVLALHPDIIEALLSFGVDPYQKDNNGRTPLHVAAMHWHLSVSDELEDIGPKAHCERVFALLLKTGMSIWEKDNDSLTPLQLSCSNRLHGPCLNLACLMLHDWLQKTYGVEVYGRGDAFRIAHQKMRSEGRQFETEILESIIEGAEMHVSPISLIGPFRRTVNRLPIPTLFLQFLGSRYY